MDDLNNPFRSPGSDEPDATSEDAIRSEDEFDPRTIGKARHVPTVAILMIAHGVLMFLAGCGLIAMIFFIVPQLSQQLENQQKMQGQQNPNAPQFTQEGAKTMFSAVYGGMAAVLFIIGAVDVFAGILNYGYRQRIFGVITLVINMGSVMFCWCLPFSVGLLIFGMIIYLSPEAERAFRWRSRNPSLP